MMFVSFLCYGCSDLEAAFQKVETGTAKPEKRVRGEQAVAKGGKSGKGWRLGRNCFEMFS